MVDNVTVSLVLGVRLISVAVLPVSVLASETSSVGDVVSATVADISVSLTAAPAIKYQKPRLK